MLSPSIFKQNALFSNITLEKIKCNLVHKKLHNTAKLSIIDVSYINVRPKSTLTSTLDEDDYLDEIFNKVKLIASQFASFSKQEIAKIFTNKFYPINLYKLRQIRRCDYIYWDQISIKKDIFKIEKIIISYKDYDRDNIL